MANETGTGRQPQKSPEEPQPHQEAPTANTGSSPGRGSSDQSSSSSRTPQQPRRDESSRNSGEREGNRPDSSGKVTSIRSGEGNRPQNKQGTRIAGSTEHSQEHGEHEQHRKAS